MANNHFNTKSLLNREKVKESYSKTKAPDMNNIVLQGAGLDQPLIMNGFKNWVRCKHDEALIFPHKDASGLSGLCVRDELREHYAGDEGLWLARDYKNSNQIVITNTAMEAMSYAACDAATYGKSLFISPNADELSNIQVKLFLQTVQKMKNQAQNPLEKIILATTNDSAGAKLANQIEIITPDEIPTQRDAPEFYPTWNHSWIDLLVSKHNDLQTWMDQTFTDEELENIVDLLDIDAYLPGKGFTILHAQNYVDVLSARFKDDIWLTLQESLCESGGENMYAFLGSHRNAPSGAVIDDDIHTMFLVQCAAYHVAKRLLNDYRPGLDAEQEFPLGA